MAKYRVHLNTFKEAEDHWKSIVPVRGRVDDDVRPLGCRSRNYERIDRLNDNEYVVWSEWHSSWIMDRTARAIRWERTATGEYVHISNGYGDYGHNSLYCFLDFFLPNGLFLEVKNGKQYIVWRDKGNKFAFGKDKLHKTFLPKATENDTRTITFKRLHKDSGDTPHWALITSPWVPAKTVVDKELKAKSKGELKRLTDWAWTMIPLLRGETGDIREGIVGNSEPLSKALKEHATKALGINGEDPCLESGLTVVNMYMNYCDDNRRYYREAGKYLWDDPAYLDAKKFRSSFNRYINKIAFNKKIDVHQEL